MPIYEFYCSACHTLLNFFSPTVDTRRRPACPHCGSPDLERRPARFATLRHRDAAGEPEGIADPDAARLEQAMEAMAPELEAAEAGEDPRRMGRLLRRFSELSGVPLGPRMESLMARLEAGEDPETIEAEMEGLDEGDDLALAALRRAASGGRRRPPRVDEELHFL